MSTNILNLDRPNYDRKPGWHETVKMPKKATFDPKKDYFATLKTTLGEITVRFFPELAPQHVTSFINLCEIGYYEGAPFHRIIPGFMMQGGDPTGTGTGGPGYKMPQEFNATKHVKGILSTARTNDPNSAGSQFFVMFTTYPSLDNQYTVFGEVVQGLEVVEKFEKIGSPSGRPKQDAKIESASVFTKDK